jgi:hypothetical protein
MAWLCMVALLLTAMVVTVYDGSTVTLVLMEML